MNRRICAELLAVLCAVSAVMTGCGSRGDATAIERKGEKASSVLSENGSDEVSSDDESTAEESSSQAADESSDTEAEDDSSSQAEKYVETRTPVDYNVNGWYGFTINNFDMVYSNEELKECFDKVQKICNDANFSMGFSYKNINTGVYVGYNQYNKYMTCSTIKAPLVKSLLVKGIDLDKEISRTYIWPGDSGELSKEAYGTVHTAKELIEYTIQKSDNTAYYILCKTFGTDVFNQTQYKLGSGYTLGYYGEWIFTYCTSDDMMKDYEDIYWFAEENEQGKWLIDLMCDTDLNIQIGQALGDKYRVAQKYGSEFNENVFNDCAIVYADSPFVLCIFTNQRPETEESCKVFRDLALAFDEINSLIADETLMESADSMADDSSAT